MHYEQPTFPARVTRPRRRLVSCAQYLLGRDDGPPPPRRHIAASRGSDGRPVSPIRRRHGNQRQRTSESSRTVAAGRRFGLGLPSTRVLQAALHPVSDERPHPCDRRLQYRESAALPSYCTTPRNRSPTQPGCGAMADHAAATHGAF